MGLTAREQKKSRARVETGLATAGLILPRIGSILGSGLTGPNGVVIDEVTGKGKTGVATALLVLLRGISSSGAGGAGLGVGIGAISRTFGGSSEGVARTGGPGAEIDTSALSQCFEIGHRYEQPNAGALMAREPPTRPNQRAEPAYGMGGSSPLRVV